MNISADEAKETQKQLRKFNLLEVNPETKRFSLHDLIRAFTDAKLSDNERFQMQFVHAQYYAALLYFTKEIRANDRENGFLTALRLIDAEWNNITAGQKWTTKFIEKDNDIANLCTDYSGYARDFTTLRLHPREDIKWLETSLKAARKLNNRQHEGVLIGSMGLAYFRLGDCRKAIEYQEQYLSISRELGDRSGEGISLGNLGNAYHSLSEYPKAIKYHEQALIIFREIGDRSGESSSLGNLGLAYHKVGEYRKAIQYHKCQLEISREIGNRLGEGNSLTNLGIVYGSLGEREKACDSWKKALVIFEAIESPTVNLVRELIENFCGE